MAARPESCWGLADRAQATKPHAVQLLPITAGRGSSQAAYGVGLARRSLGDAEKRSPLEIGNEPLPWMKSWMDSKGTGKQAD